MKKLDSLWGLIFCLVFTSCYKEDILTSTEGDIELRYSIPQGNHTWDDDIAKIYNQFGVYLIYDDLTNADFNRTWTSGGFANEHVGSSSLNDAMTEGYVKFMKNHIFPYISNKEVTNKILPMYWYLGYNINAHTRIEYGEMVLEYNVPLSNYFEGLDYWSICMYGLVDPVTEAEFFTPKTQSEYSQFRNMILAEILRRAIEKKNIKIPVEFQNGFDHQTPLVNSTGREADPNYYLNRGYPGSMNLVKFRSINAPAHDQIPPTNGDTFFGYMTIQMFYTQDRISEVYPAQKYPIIAEKMKYVYNYMKQQYNIDLDQLARGPEDWETCIQLPNNIE